MTDPTFFTTYQRVTQRSADRYPSPAITPEYAKADPSNADGTLVILRGTDAFWYLYDTARFTLRHGGPIPNLPQDDIEPRWDPVDPDVFYFRQGDDATFRAFNVETNTATPLHDFARDVAGAVTILNGSEGDASADGRYWAFEVRGDPPDADNILAVVTYDRQADRVIGTKAIPRGGVTPNWVGISPSGAWVIFPPEDGVNPLTAYSLDFRTAVPITRSAGHSDVARDRNGRDVIVYQDNATDVIAMADLATGAVTPLLAIPFDVQTDLGIHISGNNVATPGWVVVTTGGSSYRSWMDRQIFMLELRSDPRVWRLGFTHLAQCARESEYNYFAEGWATVNRAGTRLWWQANDDVPACDGDHEDVYQMILPPPPPDTANPGGTLAAAGLSPDHIATMPQRGPAMSSWRVRPAGALQERSIPAVLLRRAVLRYAHCSSVIRRWGVS